jgi:hypothetical protein
VQSTAFNRFAELTLSFLLSPESFQELRSFLTAAVDLKDLSVTTKGTLLGKDG